MKSINQTGNQVFSFERYLALLKTYLIENGKTIGLYTVVFFGITILIESFLGLKLQEYETALPLIGMYIFCVITMGTALSSSLMFSTMQDKAGRIGTLMLPASHVEKFAVRTTVYLILYIITATIVIFIGEGVRYLCAPQDYVGCLDILKVLRDETFLKYAWLILSSSVVSSHAIFTLGSILWPRKSFLKTYAVMVAIQIAIAIIVPISIVGDYFNSITGIDIESYKIWMYLFSLAYSAVFYVIAFILFRRAQVIQRFM
jgi:hypothetical protein